MTARRPFLTSCLLAVVLAACSAGSSGTSVTPPARLDLTITAEGNAFDVSTITLAAGEVTTMFFENLDGQPHNVAIYPDESASESLFVGEVITDGAITYKIPALEPGEYVFRCDVHPAMSGIVAVEG